METYLKDFADFASEGSISNENSRSDLHAGRECLVRASDFGRISLEVEISSDLEDLVLDKSDGASFDHSSADLGSLSVEHDGADFVGALLEGLAESVD